MRQKVLIGTLAVLVLIVGWVYLVPSDGDEGPPRGGARVGGGGDPESGLPAPAPRLPTATGAVLAAGSAGASGQAPQTVASLRLAVLSRTPPSFVTGRDPWRFVEPPPPPPPPPRLPTAAELRAMREAEEARLRLAAEQARLAAIDAATPKPPPFTWSYLGNFGPANQRIAVFTDGQRVWNARQGDTLESKFIVAEIGFESVAIRFVGFPEVPAQRLAVKH